MIRDLWIGAIALTAAAAVIAVLRSAQEVPNPTIAALLLLLTVLATATVARLRVALGVSFAVMIAFNYFLLPPFGTLTIADPQNWVALFVFLAVAIVASQLSGALRQRSMESLTRQRDLERLYALSRSLLLFPADGTVATGIARSIADAFEVPGVALYDHYTGAVHWGGTVERAQLGETLREVARHGRTVQVENATVTAVRLGGAPIGSLAIIGASFNDTVLQSVTNLVAIGLERARGHAATAHAEAARQSSELRAAVLDAAAHEFKTPLTSLKAAATALAADSTNDARRHELTTIVNEDLARLEALVTDAVQMLRIDSGDFVIHRERHLVTEITRQALAEFAARLDGHRVVTHVPSGLWIQADASLLRLAMRQLLDNALKYSPPTSTIEIGASADGDRGVQISVGNSGSTIPQHEQPLVAEHFFRGEQGRHVPGTGMGLAIVRQIVEAHGGTLVLSSSPDLGTHFTLTFPDGVMNA